MRAIVMTNVAALSFAVLLLAGLNAPAAAQPAEVIHLFNGKDLSGFYSWLVDDHRADPDRVFTVVGAVDGAPAIRVSGQKYGGIATTQEFESYHLVVEFRWGSVTWAPRLALARDSGVLVHCQGPDGNTGKDFNGPWMRSIEAQIIEGGVGDFIVVAGSDDTGTRLQPRVDGNGARQIGSASFATTPAAHRAFSLAASGSTGPDATWTEATRRSGFAASPTSRATAPNGRASKSSSSPIASPTWSTATWSTSALARASPGARS